MANFIAIFYAPKFITAEKQDIAPIQDLHSAWQIAKFSESDPAAIQDYRRWRNHSWYLDTTVIPFVLAKYVVVHRRKGVNLEKIVQFQSS